MEKQRIEYIDAMRGFTMLLVVYSHVELFSCGIDNIPSFNQMFLLFHMPLFFFISGFMSYKAVGYWTKDASRGFLRRKVRQQLLPTIVFMTFHYLVFRYDLVSALGQPYKQGYWFTFVLFEFFMFYVAYQVLFKWLSGIKMGGGISDILFVAFACGIHKFHGSQLNAALGSCSGWLSAFCWQYFLYFAFGVMVRKYFERFERALDSRWFMTAAIPTFFAAFIFRDMRHVMLYIVAFFGVTLTFAFFRRYQKSFSSDTRIGYALQYIGRRTLDVYLLHYFFLPYNLKSLGHWLADNPNPTIEFFMLFGVTLMVTAICLVVSALIRISPILAWLTLGQKTVNK